MHGLLIAQTGTTANPYLYRGEQWDEDLRLYYQRARHLNADTGRFWTQDSYEGSPGTPASLHKYLYANGDPVGGWDPSGFSSTFLAEAQLNLMLLGFATSLVIASPIGIKAVNDALGVGNELASELAEGVIGSYEAAAAAASAMQILLASSTQLLISKVKARLGALYISSLFPVKVVPVPKSLMPNVGQHVEDAQSLGKPIVLSRVSRAIAKRNRRAAISGFGSAGVGYSWDEYPFASSAQGGAGASVRKVPAWENSVQGGIISAAYLIEGIVVGDPYLAIVIP